MLRVAVGIFASSLFLFGQNADPASALITRYCVGCHNDKLKTAGVSLSALRPSDVGPDGATWEKVLRKVRTGEMPPLGLPAPDAESRASFTRWLEGKLDHASAAAPNPGAPAIHRLNRAEYSNAVRDLLALDLDHAESLPPDDSGYGFDNIGDVLTVSPLHMEKYMSTARRVSRLALGTLKAKPTMEKISGGRGAAAEAADELPLSERGGIVVRRYFPLDAEYSFTVRMRGAPDPNAPGPKLDVRVDGRRVKLFDVNINAAEEAQDT